MHLPNRQQTSHNEYRTEYNHRQPPYRPPEGIQRNLTQTFINKGDATETMHITETNQEEKTPKAYAIFFNSHFTKRVYIVNFLINLYKNFIVYIY